MVANANIINTMSLRQQNVLAASLEGFLRGKGM
jgi:hypothetical protein